MQHSALSLLISGEAVVNKMEIDSCCSNTLAAGWGNGCGDVLNMSCLFFSETCRQAFDSVSQYLVCYLTLHELQ